jgi:hypothetical protein
MIKKNAPGKRGVSSSVIRAQEENLKSKPVDLNEGKTCSVSIPCICICNAYARLGPFSFLALFVINSIS